MRFSQNLARNVKILLTIFFKVIIIALFYEENQREISHCARFATR